MSLRNPSQPESTFGGRGTGGAVRGGRSGSVSKTVKPKTSSINKAVKAKPKVKPKPAVTKTKKVVNPKTGLKRNIEKKLKPKNVIKHYREQEDKYDPAPRNTPYKIEKTWMRGSGKTAQGTPPKKYKKYSVKSGPDDGWFEWSTIQRKLRKNNPANKKVIKYLNGGF